MSAGARRPAEARRIVEMHCGANTFAARTVPPLSVTTVAPLAKGKMTVVALTFARVADVVGGGTTPVQLPETCELDTVTVVPVWVTVAAEEQQHAVDEQPMLLNWPAQAWVVVPVDGRVKMPLQAMPVGL